ncbi:MFS transporter [Sphingomonas populi]|uniref:MFS transporter n=1 Tax=Sphingomonas populi TaxID=2484750 RepID=A0A4Q6XV88_9SPHN|nr:MFS transporter [Sphingomonas populi]RZF63875.1 MFS transporter [Sphingomonas populi]
MPRPSSAKASPLKSIFIVSSGNFLEMYDFMVFGYYAKAIGATFFPAQNESASILLSLMTFGAGFLMRPVGALVLGAYMDRHGRRRGLLLTLALMGVGTLSIACMPSYAQIGIFAPLLILAGRLIQGLSAGVEVGGVSVYLAELASPNNRGFYVAWQSASQQVAVVFAALIGLALSYMLPPTEIASWGWRIPFFIGSALLPFLFVIRGMLQEDVSALEESRPDMKAIFTTVADHAGVILLGALMAVMTTVFFYMITAYTPTYGNSVLKLSAPSAMTVTLCVGLLNFAMLPTMGALSDRIGRTPLLIGSALLAIMTGYPALAWLTSDPSFGRLLGVELWLALVYAAYNGAMVVHLAEVMPARARTAGFSLAYSLATAIFGGFTPALSTYLIARSGNPAMPGVWLSFAAVISLAATLLLARSKQKAFRDRPLPLGSEKRDGKLK